MKIQNFKRKSYKKLVHKYIYDLKNKKMFEDLDLAYKKIKGLWKDQDQLNNPRYSYVIGILLTSIGYNHKKKNIIDIGCGYGSLVNYLNTFRNIKAIGTDVSEFAIDKGRKKFSTNKIFVHNFLKEQFSIKKKFDYVLVLGTFWFLLLNFKTFIKNLKKNINLNTKIIFQINIPKDNNIFKNIVKTESDLINFLKKFLVIKNIYKITNLVSKSGKVIDDYDFLIIVALIKKK